MTLTTVKYKLKILHTYQN